MISSSRSATLNSNFTLPLLAAGFPPHAMNLFVHILALVLGYLSTAVGEAVFTDPTSKNRLSLRIITIDPDGHSYELFPSSVPWVTALDLASTKSYNGNPGHLATITSLSEQSFVNGNLVFSSLTDVWIAGNHTCISETLHFKDCHFLI